MNTWSLLQNMPGWCFHGIVLRGSAVEVAFGMGACTDQEWGNDCTARVLQFRSNHALFPRPLLSCRPSPVLATRTSLTVLLRWNSRSTYYGTTPLLRVDAKHVQDPLLLAAPKGLDPDLAMEVAAARATARLQVTGGTTLHEGEPGAKRYNWTAMGRAKVTVTDDSR